MSFDWLLYLDLAQELFTQAASSPGEAIARLNTNTPGGS
jgi:hypothetical protein